MKIDLTAVNYEFLLDKSASMNEKDCPGGKTRWAYAQEVVKGLALKAESYDKDGIAVVPFAKMFKVHDGVTADKVSQVFAEHEPNGSTHTHLVVADRFKAHFDRKAAGDTRATLIFVMTDGEPESQPELIKTIVAASKQMDKDEELAIQFIQIGQDPACAARLKELDDDLQGKYGAKFDIVDTVTIDEIEGLTFAELVQKSYDD